MVSNLRNYLRWSPRGRPWPRGHILKSLASKPQVLENWPVLGSRTALFLNRWNFVGKRQKPCGKSARPFFWFPQVEIAWKRIFEDVFRLKKILRTFFLFLENTYVCVLGPWPREGLSLALKFFCGLGLEPCVLDSNSGNYDLWGGTPLAFPDYASPLLQSNPNKIIVQLYFWQTLANSKLHYRNLEVGLFPSRVRLSLQSLWSKID